MSGQHSLFDPPSRIPGPPSHKDRILAQHEAKHRAYLDKLRAALRDEYRALRRPLSADDAHRLRTERPELRMPGDMSPMALGGVFRGDRDDNGRARWRQVGFTESTRGEAHSNVLRTWELVE